ncbi:histone deacetylase [Gloeophyllum trabeum ATCC 11539]|uniref:histone deacetylase n=1 Tax=Gloeophyllum trabeum (strain ATCC 11539 / FP-39264 / Madison 617) TaxID=670483 RepID=S7PYP0_GLOTA|nr:histone deacetylase [Gloeophyllum trabeum ATCC 11539]EPQ52568.1 histone deacetylase [Gloeophyllum trabeum ATCC 11539]
MSLPDRRRVTYYFDPEVGGYTYDAPQKGEGRHCMKPHRIFITHHLVRAYNMLDKMHVLRAKRATPEDMTRFHTDEYVNFLQRVTPETAEDLTYKYTRFLSADGDNPAFEGLFEFCSISAGGSLAAARAISSSAADIAINWAGGLHHAKKREASGFCYINDINLAILELLRTYPRVLYIDIDCHHGDGVEEAFYTTDRVMTCSFHKFGDFFPGTGDYRDTGFGKGKGYSVNVPLREGITDEAYKSLFEPIISKILEVFLPSAVVLQCGADSLAGDKLGELNLSMHGHAACVQFLRKQNVPLMLLGGGGYTAKNVARTWCYETACALGIEDTIDPMLPYNAYFEWFGPRYRLEVPGTNREDYNLRDGYVHEIRQIVLQQLSQLQPAPSVGIHDVPSESVGDHLGWRMAESEPRDELDKDLAQHARLIYKIQEAEAYSDETDDTDSDSLSRRMPRRAPRKRMSIVTNKVLDTPQLHEFEREHEAYCGHVGKHTRRRFFEWDNSWRGPDSVVEVYTLPGLGVPGVSVGESMAGGRRGYDLDVDDGMILMD